MQRYSKLSIQAVYPQNYLAGQKYPTENMMYTHLFDSNPENRLFFALFQVSKLRNNCLKEFPEPYYVYEFFIFSHIPG